MKFQARSSSAQLQQTLGAATAYGVVTTLEDPRFREEHAADSLWRPYDFIFDVGPGVYFLEPYDARKIPVLFVHGINGTPTNFRFLIEHLDRTKYQPWLYYYPSGVRLSGLADHLDQTMKTLQLQHGFTQYHVIAHSMGGLVSRGFPVAESIWAELVRASRSTSRSPRRGRDTRPRRPESITRRRWCMSGTTWFPAVPILPIFSSRTVTASQSIDGCRMASSIICYLVSSIAETASGKVLTARSLWRVNCIRAHRRTPAGSTVSTRHI